jgi:hypothetical protein
MTDREARLKEQQQYTVRPDKTRQQELTDILRRIDETLKENEE